MAKIGSFMGNASDRFEGFPAPSSANLARFQPPQFELSYGQLALFRQQYEALNVAYELAIHDTQDESRVEFLSASQSLVQQVISRYNTSFQAPVDRAARAVMTLLFAGALPERQSALGMADEAYRTGWFDLNDQQFIRDRIILPITDIRSLPDTTHFAAANMIDTYLDEQIQARAPMPTALTAALQAYRVGATMESSLFSSDAFNYLFKRLRPQPPQE